MAQICLAKLQEESTFSGQMFSTCVCLCSGLIRLSVVHMLLIKRLHSCTVHKGFREVALDAENVHLERQVCPWPKLDQGLHAHSSYIPMIFASLPASLPKLNRRVGQCLIQPHLQSIWCGGYRRRNKGLHIFVLDEVIEATLSCLIYRF